MKGISGIDENAIPKNGPFQLYFKNGLVSCQGEFDNGKKSITMRKLFPIFLLIILITSCARSYHTIYPEFYNYDNKKPFIEGITVSYFYDVQNHVRNKPYARKERKNGLKLVAIKVENKSDSAITLTRQNFNIQTSSGRNIYILENSAYTSIIRQFPETFIIFYGLAGIQYEWGNVNGESYSRVTYNPIPIIVGIINAIIAGNSNSKQKENLEKNEIFNRTIHPNSSIFGLIAIKEAGYPELNFIYREN